jgi:hypothetical protein
MYALSTSTVPSSAYERDWGGGMDGWMECAVDYM